MILIEYKYTTFDLHVLGWNISLNVSLGIRNVLKEIKIWFENDIYINFFFGIYLKDGKDLKVW